MSGTPGGLRAACWNLEGLPSKLPAVMGLFKFHRLDAFLGVETWLRSHTSVVTPHGYKASHITRSSPGLSRRGHGGISLLTKASTAVTLLARCPHAHWAVWAVRPQHTTTILAGVYLPPAPTLRDVEVTAALDELHLVLEGYIDGPLLVVGDFNTRLGNLTGDSYRGPTQRPYILQSFCARLGLTNAMEHARDPQPTNVGTSRHGPYSSIVDYALLGGARSYDLSVVPPPTPTTHRVLLIYLTTSGTASRLAEHRGPVLPHNEAHLLLGSRLHWNRRALRRRSGMRPAMDAILQPLWETVLDRLTELPTELADIDAPARQATLDTLYESIVASLATLTHQIASGRPPRTNQRLKKALSYLRERDRAASGDTTPSALPATHAPHRFGLPRRDQHSRANVRRSPTDTAKSPALGPHLPPVTDSATARPGTPVTAPPDEVIHQDAHGLNPHAVAFVPRPPGFSRPPSSRPAPDAPTTDSSPCPLAAALNHLPMSAFQQSSKRLLHKMKERTFNQADRPSLDDLHSFWSSIFEGRTQPSDPIPSSDYGDPTEPVEALDANPFDNPAMTTTIESRLARARPGKAVGLDQISSALLACCAGPAAAALRHLFSICFRWEITPTCWRDVRMILIPKQGVSTDPANYRPIALSSHLRKLYELLLLQWLEPRGVFSTQPEQCGFQRRTGAADVALMVAEALDSTRRLKHDALLLTLDIQKAYDSVVRPFLYALLYTRGVRRKDIRILQSLFEGCGLFIEQPEAGTTVVLHRIAVTTGLLQGAVLSPRLFNVFLDPLLEELLALKIYSPSAGGQALSAVGFADDLALLAMLPTAPTDRRQAERRVQAQLDLCTSFGLRRGLRFAPHKCSVSLSGGQLQRPLRLQDTDLEHTSDQIYLGLPFHDAAIHVDGHISNLVTKMERANSLLVASGLYRSQVTWHKKVLLFKALVRSRGEYGLAHLPLHGRHHDQLDGALNNAIGIMLGSRRGSYAQRRLVGCDASRSRLQLLKAAVLLRAHQHRRRPARCIVRGLEPRNQRRSFITRVFDPTTRALFDDLRAIEDCRSAAVGRVERQRWAAIASRRRREPALTEWRRLGRSRPTVRRLQNDPRRTHPCLRVQDEATGFLLTRLATDIWPPAAMICTRCPPASPPRQFRVGIVHASICAGIDTTLRPALERLDEEYRAHHYLSNEQAVTPLTRFDHTDPAPSRETKELLFHVLALSTRHMKWGSDPAHDVPSCSADLLGQLRSALLAMRQIVACGSPAPRPPPASADSSDSAESAGPSALATPSPHRRQSKRPRSFSASPPRSPKRHRDVGDILATRPPPKSLTLPTSAPGRPSDSPPPATSPLCPPPQKRPPLPSPPQRPQKRHQTRPRSTLAQPTSPSPQSPPHPPASPPPPSADRRQRLPWPLLQLSPTHGTSHPPRTQHRAQRQAGMRSLRLTSRTRPRPTWRLELLRRPPPTRHPVLRRLYGSRRLPSDEATQPAQRSSPATRPDTLRPDTRSQDTRGSGPPGADLQRRKYPP